MTSVDANKERVYAEKGYFSPEVLRRPNLKVAINAQVIKILVEVDADGRKRAAGVEFANSEKGPTFHVYASKEVLVRYA